IALVAIACIAIFMALSGEINSMFSKSNSEVDGFKPFGVGYDKETGTPIYNGGELGGTSGSPVTSCSGNNCSIDYGDFVLNGLPDNFSELVETSGTSGANDQLASILENLADQIEGSDPGGSALLKKLAQTASLIANVQSQVEDKATYCKGQADPVTCFNSWYSSSTSANINFPPEYQTLMPEMFAHPGDMRNIIDMMAYTYPGQAAVGYPNIGTPPELTYPGSAVNYYYQQIDSSGLSSNIKDATKEIVDKMNMINMDFYGTTSRQILNNINPFTGSFTADHINYSGSTVNDVLQPDISNQISFFADQILCLNGRTGSSCN
ncbi:MAG: hypothetical protein AB1782_13145, partial [Cyanobacteriota bacterium]